MSKPPRRNLPPEAELWGRDVDARIQQLENSMGRNLTNLQASASATASTLNRLGAGAHDSGWLDLPSIAGSLTTTRALIRRTGLLYTINMQLTGNFLVGANNLYGPGFLNTEYYPDHNMWAPVFLAAGYSGNAVMRSDGSISVYQQTGATRSGAQFQITYPLKAPIQDILA